MAKKYTLSREDICELYDLNMHTLKYHMYRKPSAQNKTVFPKGVFGKKRKMYYNAADVKKYADANWKGGQETQAPLKLVKPLTKAELVKELEPGLNALFGAAAQDAAFNEENEANAAVLRVLEEKLSKLEEDYARSSRFNLVFGAGLAAIAVILILWTATQA